MASIREVPPVYVSAYAIAVALGALKPPEASSDQPEVEGGGQKGDAFLAAFGASGSL